MSVDDDASAADGKIDDKYSKPIPPSASKDEDKRDSATVKRESFLNIYNENNDGGDNEDSGAPDLSNGIRYRQDEEEESDFQLKTEAESSKKPLI